MPSADLLLRPKSSDTVWWEYCFFLPSSARFFFISWTRKGFDHGSVNQNQRISGNAKFKQSDLAELVGVRRETIVNLERGKYNPSLKLAMDIAKIFHATVEEVFSYENISAR